MYIQQLYTNCLAEAAYYIESDGEAAIIDPLRETDQYVALAESRNAKIKYVFETHFHADFVSGHKDLAEKTGAVIVYGPTGMQTGFKMLVAQDHEVFKLGKVSLEVLHTPGHTMESSCFLLCDENNQATAIFTGDTLFIGDVGRPDLAQHVIAELTEEKLAGHLYDSLRNKIMPLSDDLIVYPGHGAGSACGKNMSKETTDTLGHQKKVNYALNPSLTREAFIASVLSGLTPPPGYFPQNVLLNIQGYEPLDVVMQRGLNALDAETFETIVMEEHAVIIDTRDAQEFADGFIPDAINIGLNGSFAVWVGTLIPDVKQKIVLVVNEGKEQEVVTRLSRVGYDGALGFLKGGMDAWKKSGKPVDTIQSVSADELFNRMQKGNLNILDVRKKSEYNAEHLMEAVNAPLDYIHHSEVVLYKDQTYYVHCAGGYRSMTYISILKSLGYQNLIDVRGGITAMKATGKFSFSEYVPQSSML